MANLVLKSFAALTMLFFAGVARSQVAVYANYEGDRMYSTWYSGGTFGVYDDFYRLGPIHVGADVRGSVLTDGNSNKSTRVLGGLRLAVKPPILPFQPYAEILTGASSTGVGGVSGSAHATVEATGGLDYTFFPHLDWRVVDIGGTVAQTGSDNNFHISTGLVVRFF